MRKVTVTYSARERDYVPMIRLRGKWLERAGFQEGRSVQVVVASGRLILTIEDGVATDDCGRLLP